MNAVRNMYLADLADSQTGSLYFLTLIVLLVIFVGAAIVRSVRNRKKDR